MNEIKLSKTPLFIRCCADVRPWDSEIMKRIKDGNPSIPEELEGIFTLEPVDVADGTRYILDFI